MHAPHLVEILEMRIAPAAATFVWDGEAGDRKWATGTNWVGDVAPTQGSALLFPVANSPDLINDFASGTEFASLTISGASAHFRGNEIVLTEGIATTGSGTAVFFLPLKLGADQTFSADIALSFFESRIDFNGHTLTLAGPGSFDLEGQSVDSSAAGGAQLLASGTGSLYFSAVGETAPVKIVTNGAPVRYFAELPNTALILNGGTLDGVGTMGDLISNGATITGGRILLETPFNFFVHGSFKMDEASTFRPTLPIPEEPPPTGHGGYVDVTGTVDLGGATLSANVAPQPRSGDQYEIIRNDGADPIIGTFRGLPEGALLNGVNWASVPTAPKATNVQFRVSYQGGDGNDVVLTADFPEIQLAEGGHLGTFTDVDGDLVTIKTKTGQLNPRDFRLVRAGGVGGSQLVLIDLRAEASAAALRGTNFKITAEPGPQGGDGHVNVGAVEARFAFNHFLIDGDLSRANFGTFAQGSKLVVDHFDVQSIGAFGTKTQLQDSDTGAIVRIAGDVHKLKVEGDVRHTLAVGVVQHLSIAGSLIGGDAAKSGSILAEQIVGRVKIARDVKGGSGNGSGSIVVGHPSEFRGPFSGINSIVIGGSLIGGTADGSGSVRAFSGSIGSVTIGGSVMMQSDAPLVGAATIAAKGQIGSIQITKNLVGTAANPVLITAGGSPSGLVNDVDIAIGALEVGGNVKHLQLLAGYAFTSLDPGDARFALAPVNADGSIGNITVTGNWTASNALAGVGPGADGFFGTRDDAQLRGAGVHDNPDAFSAIASIIVKGTVNGTVRAGDAFGIVAQQLGMAQFGNTIIAFKHGARNERDFVMLGSTGPGATGIPRDFTIREAKG